MQSNSFLSSNLEELISKLNDEDHSEDEGIEDYNVGGYHPCHIGEILMFRYVLMQKLGWGHFSTVWLAKDFRFGSYVAVKIMKSSPHYLQASYDEVEILQKVANNAFHPEWIAALGDYEPGKKPDRDDTHVLNLLNSFLYKGPYGNHFCMVFQILGVNLLQILKRYDEKGLPIQLVKEIARQVLMGLDFLNRICRVIHTDLKPQNVLLCLPDEQIRSIFQKETGDNLQLYKDRLNYYRHHYKLGEMDPDYTMQVGVQQQSQINATPKPKKEESDEESAIGEDQAASITEKIQQINMKLKAEDLSKAQRKNLRRKLKKYEQKQVQKPKKEIQKIKKRLLPQTKKLFSSFKCQMVLDGGARLSKGFKVKIADLGNACWQHHHFASEIQTRQYRGPQILIGAKYNITADMWSAACMFFQMLTGQLLFNPRKDTSETFGKNDDHLAQMMELLGRFPRKFSLSGNKSKKFFNRDGSLRRLPKLQNWSVRHVMIAKYRFVQSQAILFEKFMNPMLQCLPYRRVTARQMLKHPWLHSEACSNYLMSSAEHARIRAERYQLDQPKEEVNQYESEKEDADEEDNGTVQSPETDDAFYAYEKRGQLRMVDRSFMDLGYIGYGDGIYLQSLDTGPNWQFDKL